jgi:hypothetical protein
MKKLFSFLKTISIGAVACTLFGLITYGIGLATPKSLQICPEPGIGNTCTTGLYALMMLGAAVSILFLVGKLFSSFKDDEIQY